MQFFFLELQCLVDDLVDFLELSMFINAFLPYYLIKWIEELDVKKINKLLDTIYIAFS